jgi:hypothetical protein
MMDMYVPSCRYRGIGMAYAYMLETSFILLNSNRLKVWLISAIICDASIEYISHVLLQMM